jgi:hypothetical protein
LARSVCCLGYCPTCPELSTHLRSAGHARYIEACEP